jgi:hypothetical protein
MAEKIRGPEVLIEAADFLSEMKVSHQHSGYAVGFHSTVLVRPHYDAGGSFLLMVNCQSLMNRTVDWDRISVAVHSVDRRQSFIKFPVALDRSGEARLTGLSEGEYQLSGLKDRTTIDRARWMQPRQKEAAGDTRTAGAVRTRGGLTQTKPEPTSPQTSPADQSIDGSVEVRVGAADGGISVEFRSVSSENLDAREVEFTFVSKNDFWDPGSRAKFQQEVVERPGGKATIWVARWKGKAPPEGMDTLLFTLLPESRA